MSTLFSTTRNGNDAPEREPTNATPAEVRKHGTEQPQQVQLDKQEPSKISVLSNDPTITSFGGPESEVVSESDSSDSDRCVLQLIGEESAGMGTPSSKAAWRARDDTSSESRRKRPEAPKPRLKHRSRLRADSANPAAGLEVRPRGPSGASVERETLGISGIGDNVWNETWYVPPPLMQRGYEPVRDPSFESPLNITRTESRDWYSETYINVLRGKQLKYVETSGSNLEDQLSPVICRSDIFKSTLSRKTKKKWSSVRASKGSADKEPIKSLKGRRVGEKKGKPQEKEISRFGTDSKQKNILGNVFGEDIKMPSSEDSFRKIWDRKSGPSGVDAMAPVVRLTKPPSIKWFVPSKFLTPGERRSSVPTATKYCPWKAKTILDSWVPRKVKFPSWLTSKEQGAISKSILNETKFSCKPRQKSIIEIPSCCALKKHDAKTKVKLKHGDLRKDIRPEMKRWIMGYPENTRFIREIQDLFRNPPSDVVVHYDDENNRHIYVDLEGPKKSLYCNGIFRIEVFFPSEYPKDPPKMRFMTKIFHPGVDKLGRIRLPEIQESWNKTLLMRDVLKALKKALCDPNLEAPIAIDVARRWFWQEVAAKKIAQHWTKKYAHHHSSAAWLDCHCDCCCEQLATASLSH